MKKSITPIILTVVALFMACSSGSKYSFTDQLCTGKIVGAEWTFICGTAEVDPFDDAKYKYNLYNEDLDLCIGSSSSDYMAFFTLPADTGLYNLGFSSDSYSVTMYHGGSNIMAIQGAIHITSINLSDSTIVGKIDARGDDENFLNGNFKVSFCGNRY